MRKLKKYSANFIWNGHESCRINIILPVEVINEIEKETKGAFIGSYLRELILEKYFPGRKWNPNPEDRRTDCRYQNIERIKNG